MYNKKINYKEFLEIKNKLIDEHEKLKKYYINLYNDCKRKNKKWADAFLYALGFEEGIIQGLEKLRDKIYEYLQNQN
jgi:hypothetical protein